MLILVVVLNAYSCNGVTIGSLPPRFGTFTWPGDSSANTLWSNSGIDYDVLCLFLVLTDFHTLHTSMDMDLDFELNLDLSLMWLRISIICLSVFTGVCTRIQFCFPSMYEFTSLPNSDSNWVNFTPWFSSFCLLVSVIAQWSCLPIFSLHIWVVFNLGAFTLFSFPCLILSNCGVYSIS